MKNKTQLIILIIIGCLIGMLTGIYIYVSEAYNSEMGFVLLLTCSIIGALGSLIITQLTKTLNRVIPWQKHYGIRLFLGVVLSWLILILCTSLALMIWSLKSGSDLQVHEILRSDLNIKLSILLFIVSIIGNIIYVAFYTYYQYSSETIEIIKSERKQIDLHINALKSQLSPHFLFNNLNTISSLLHKDPYQAEAFIRKMAESYRYTLKSYNSNMVTLAEEIEFVKSSMYLIQTRFNNSGKLEIELDEPTLKTMVPSLSVQMLVENALKHNLSTAEWPLKIKIYNDEKFIVVTNNKTSAPLNVKSTKVGLKNIRHRYQLLCQEDIKVSDNIHFSVKLPLIK